MKTLIAWFTIISIMSVYPMPSGTEPQYHSDKFLHAIVYGITCVLFYVYLKDSTKPIIRRYALHMAFVFSTTYGFLMEVLQGQLSTRVFSGYDALANAVGAALGIVWVVLIAPSAKKRAR